MMTDKHSRRFFLASLAANLNSTPAFGFEIPGIKIISPYPPGASVDFWARKLEEKLKSGINQNTSITYAPGGSGLVAAKTLKQQKGTSSLMILLSGMNIFSQMPYIESSGLDFNPHHEFSSFSILWDEPFYIAVRKDSDLNTLEDIFKNRESRILPFSIGSTGLKSSGGLLIEYIKKNHRMDWSHIPFKGMMDIVINLRGGHIDAGLVSYQPVSKLVENGEIKLIASTSVNKNARHPKLPSLQESNVIDINGGTWFGLFAKKDADQNLINEVSKYTQEIFKDIDFLNSAKKNGFNPIGLFNKDAQDFVKRDNELWKNIIKNILLPN